MTGSQIEDRLIVAIHAPLGLGWRSLIERSGVGVAAVPADSDLDLFRARLGRAGRQSPEALAITDIHNAGPTIAEHLEEMLGQHEALVPTWLVSAIDLPNRLLPYVTDRATVGTVDRLDGNDGGELVYSAGRRDACRREGDRLEPSMALLRFFDDLRISHPKLTDLVQLVVAAPIPVDLEALAAALEVDSSSCVDLIREAELSGSLCWQGPGLVPASRAVRDAAVRSGADRRHALGLIARTAADGTFLGAVARLAVGWDVGVDERDLVLAELRRLERCAELDQGEALAVFLAEHASGDLLTDVRAALERFRLAKGQAPTPSATFVEHLPTLSVPMAFGVLDGLDLSAFDIDGATLSALIPGVPRPSSVPEGVLAPFLLAARGDKAGAMEALTRRGSHDLERVMTVATLAACDEWEEAVAFAANDPAGPPALYQVLLCLLNAHMGHFERASRDFMGLVGDDWVSVLPMFRVIGLLIANGADLETARRLRAHVPVPPVNRMGNFAAMSARARADFRLGNTEASRGRYREIWDRCTETGLHGMLHLVALDDIEANLASVGLQRWAEADPSELTEPDVRLADACLVGDCGAVIAIAESWSERPYHQARALRLAGRIAASQDLADQAAALLSRCAAMFQSLGATVDHAETLKLLRSEVLRDAGVQLRTDSRGHLDGDVDVLRCIAAGLTNKEIAAQLHISLATAKRKVSSLMREHDVSNRRELAVLVQERLLDN